jgi:hypothetical protein
MRHMIGKVLNDKKAKTLTAVVVRSVELIIVVILITQLLKGDLVPQDTSDPTESLDELTSLLRFVGDELESCSKLLVLFGEPFE